VVTRPAPARKVVGPADDEQAALPALLGVGGARPTQRSQDRVGGAGLGRLRKRQPQVDDAEPADESAGAGREQRAFQAAEGEGDVGAESRAGRVVPETARQVDRHAQSLQRIGGAEEADEVGGRLPAQALAQHAVEDEAEGAPREPRQGGGGGHVHALPEASPDRGGLAGLRGALREDDGHLRALVGEHAGRKDRIRAVVALAGEHQHAAGRAAEQAGRAYGEVRRGPDHQVERAPGLAADRGRLDGGRRGAGQDRQGGGLHLSARGPRRPGPGRRYG
jgi:hypothetical protein